MWLEGHVKKHLGPRPYYCIFPECTARFASQELLQRHVDNHFNESEPQKVVKKVELPAAKKTDKKPCNKRLRGTEKCLRKTCNPDLIAILCSSVSLMAVSCLSASHVHEIILISRFISHRHKPNALLPVSTDRVFGPTGIFSFY